MEESSPELLSLLVSLFSEEPPSLPSSSTIGCCYWLFSKLFEIFRTSFSMSLPRGELNEICFLIVLKL